MSFLKGFLSIFDWMTVDYSQSPKERVDEILNNFYSDHPEIERDDNKALEKDSQKIWENNN
jgi:hypothetical protein